MYCSVMGFVAMFTTFSPPPRFANANAPPAISTTAAPAATAGASLRREVRRAPERFCRRALEGSRWRRVDFSAKPSSRSTAMASSAISTLPAKVKAMVFVVMPRKMATPKPPAPMNVAMPASAMVMVAMLRMPLMMTGAASGSSMRYSSWRSVEPMPRAASMMAGSMVVRPV